MSDLISLEVTRAQAIVLNELLSEPNATIGTPVDPAELAALEALRGALEANLVGEWQEPSYKTVVAAAYHELREQANWRSDLTDASEPSDETAGDERL